MLNSKKGVKSKQHDEFISLSLKYKIRDNNLFMTKIKKKRNWLKGIIENSLGGRSSKCRSLFDEVRNTTSKYRETF